MKPYAYLLGGLALLAAATPSQAAITWVIDLTLDQEVPPPLRIPTTTTGAPRPDSFGTATLVLNDAMDALSLDLIVFNIDATGTQTVDINDNLTAAHVHAGPNVTSTSNGGVVWGFLGTPFNNTNPNEGVFTPFASGVGFTFSGVWNAPEGQNTTLTAQLANILGGRSYVNVHTTQFGGGEIRGNIYAVPEPATWATLLFGFGVVGLVFRQRRRRAPVLN